METSALSRIDSYPYRHTLRDVMTAPVITIGAERTLRQAAAAMHGKRIGAILIDGDDGRPRGIVTERDVLRLAAEGPEALEQKLSAVMSQPVAALPADAFLYRAIARMDRLGIRHIAVLDDAGRAIGMVSARSLLRQRASAALRLGDQIDLAETEQALATVHAALPDLARALQAEAVPATDISAVISAATRDMTARAAALSLHAMAESGKGQAPARWCLLVLGSGGRGESLLAPDQDNALIHDGGDGDDDWFAAFGERINAILDGAGVPLCKGGVMAKNPQWRRSAGQWRAAIDHWIAKPEGEALLNVDIFFDFRAVAGDYDLAQALRAYALGQTRQALPFLRLLAANAENLRTPIGLFGGFKTEAGRIDLKKGGLLPIVTAARVMALKFAIADTGTDRRLLAAQEHMPGRENIQALARARGVIIGAVLDQQLADLAAGRPANNSVDPGRLDRFERQALKQALRDAASAETLVRDALTG